MLLALAMVPAVLPDPTSWLSPFSTALFRYPVLVLGGVVALVAGLFLSAAYPVAAQESTSTAMSGMTGMSGANVGFGRGDRSDCHLYEREQWRAEDRAGRQNTPNMVMAGPGTGMNMNGADASAAAGLNTTKSNWHYTGPALPTAEAQELLAHGANGADRHPHGQTGCATEPTFSEQIDATQYVQATSQAVARYSTPAAAQAAGYVPVVTDGLPGRLLREPDHRGRQRSREDDPRSPLGRWARLCPDAVGDRGAGRRDVRPSDHTHDSTDALRLARPVAPAHRVCGPSTAAVGAAFPITGWSRVPRATTRSRLRT